MKSIFVSSTFRDMQAERDMLHMEVMPKLQEKANTYGERVSFIDLRWGVNTGDMDSESGAKKVLSVCMDEIDRSRPYMLVFLGERYGWIPDARLIEQAIEEKDFAIEEIEESVTALEIEYGALSRMGSAKRCIFCIREPLPYNQMSPKTRKDYEPESPVHKQKLDDLKKRIKNLPNAQIITYRGEWQKGKVVGLETLSQQIYDALVRMFENEWKENQHLTWQDRELMAFELFMEGKRSGFVGRESLLEQYISLIKNTDNELLRQKFRSALEQESLSDYHWALSNIVDNKAFILQGKQGSGKSSVLSMLAEKLKNQNYIVCPFICGHSGKSDQLIDMIKQMVYFLEKELNLPHFEEQKNRTKEKWQERFAELCDQYDKTKENPLAFVIDGLEQLKEEREIGTFNWIPPFLPKHIVFVISMNDEMNTSLYAEDVVMHQGVCVEQLELLPESDKKDIIGGILSANRKGIDDIVVRALLNKESSNNPMYLNMLLTRLMMMDQEDFSKADRLGGGGTGLDARMIAIIKQAPDDLEAMGAKLLQEAARKCSPKQAKETLFLLAVSRKGLSEEELETIIRRDKKEWNTVDFSRLLKYMQEFFIIREDGRIDFKTPIIRNGLLKVPSFKIKKYQKKIFNYIKSLSVTNSLWISEGLYYAEIINDKHFALLYVDEIRKQPYEIKRRGTHAIKDVIANKGHKWFASVCKLSHTLDDYAREYYWYEYLITEVLNQSIWVEDKENKFVASGVVLENIHDRVSTLYNNFDLEYDAEEPNILLALQPFRIYIKALVLYVHFLWRMTEYYMEHHLHSTVIKILKVPKELENKVRGQISEMREDMIQEIEEGEELGETEDVELKNDIMHYINWLNSQYDEMLILDVKSNICQGQCCIEIGEYEDALNNIQQADKLIQQIEQWGESDKYKIVIEEAYYDILIATDGINENNKGKIERTIENITKQYERLQEKSKTSEEIDKNDMNLWFRDGLVKQAHYRLMMRPNEALSYCEKALDVATQVVKRANTIPNGYTYAEALFLMGRYWYEKQSLEKAEDYFEQAFWQSEKYQHVENKFSWGGVLAQSFIFIRTYTNAAGMDTADETDEKEMELSLDPIDIAWKMASSYLNDSTKKTSKLDINRKQLHAVLKSANLITQALKGKGQADKALYYCNEGINYWRKCESPIYPVMMMREDVYDLYSTKAKLLETLGRKEEAIDTFKEILSFNEVTEIKNEHTLAWVLEKRKTIENEFELMSSDELDDGTE